MPPADAGAAAAASSAAAAADLRAAWNDFIERLQAARDAIDDPALKPPPATERNLAEGYRYLLGFVFSSIERACFGDPHFPYLRRAIQVLDKSTIDNADAMYLTTPIDGARHYLLRGRAADSRHWRGQPAIADGPKAPQYVIFEAHTGYAGDSGSLAELRPGGRVNTGKLDTAGLQAAADGSFEIRLGPERPAGFEGNFILSRRFSRRTQQTYTAEHLSMRVLFHDWDREQPLDLAIHELGMEGEHPPPLDAATAAAQLRRAGQIVDAQMRFWNDFYATTLEVYGDTNGDGVSYLPRNDLNAPSPAGLATGGGQSTNVYSGGVYDLGPDEVLLIETRVPVVPSYSGFHLANLWGESHDYANRQSSLNGHQAQPDPDGATRFVIAHCDPGVPNWLDTTGLPQGFMSLRWTYSELPGELPSVTVRRMRYDELRAALPAATPRVTPEQRRAVIAARQAHVQRRFRQY